VLNEGLREPVSVSEPRPLGSVLRYWKKIQDRIK